MNGDQLKHWRKQKGLSRAQLGDEFGVSEHTVAKWEQDVNPIPKAVEKLMLDSVSPQFSVPEFLHLSKLAKERDISIDALIAEFVRDRITKPGPTSWSSDTEAESVGQ